MTDEADDVAGIRFVHRFTLVAKEFVRTGEANFFLRARVMHRHVAVELAGAHADERDAVAMFRVHVCLNLEDETAERRILRRNFNAAHHARFRRGRVFQKSVQQKLHAEIIHAAAEKNRRRFTREHGRFVE